jgi:hypothetical protein
LKHELDILHASGSALKKNNKERSERSERETREIMHTVVEFVTRQTVILFAD